MWILLFFGSSLENGESKTSNRIRILQLEPSRLERPFCSSTRKFSHYSQRLILQKSAPFPFHIAITCILVWGEPQMSPLPKDLLVVNRCAPNVSVLCRMNSSCKFKRPAHWLRHNTRTCLAVRRASQRIRREWHGWPLQSLDQILSYETRYEKIRRSLLRNAVAVSKWSSCSTPRGVSTSFCQRRNSQFLLVIGISRTTRFLPINISKPGGIYCINFN